MFTEINKNFLLVFRRKGENRGIRRGRKKRKIKNQRSSLNLEIAVVKVSLTFQNLTSNMEVMFFLHFIYEG